MDAMGIVWYCESFQKNHDSWSGASWEDSATGINRPYTLHHGSSPYRAVLSILWNRWCLPFHQECDCSKDFEEMYASKINQEHIEKLAGEILFLNSASCGSSVAWDPHPSLRNYPVTDARHGCFGASFCFICCRHMWDTRTSDLDRWRARRRPRSGGPVFNQWKISWAGRTQSEIKHNCCRFPFTPLRENGLAASLLKKSGCKRSTFLREVAFPFREEIFFQAFGKWTRGNTNGDEFWHQLRMLLGSSIVDIWYNPWN